VLSVPPGGQALPPALLENQDTDRLVVISTEGRMLVFPAAELPTLSKGKGNKIIQIPTARAKAREELVSVLAILPKGHDVLIRAGKRTLTMKQGTLSEYTGDRGRRGRKLPRGFRSVSRITAIEPEQLYLI
jgi:topoisomerase-4 subunit A